MAWFKKKDDEEESGLPELPEMETVMPAKEKTYLPSFPPSYSGNKMSENVVKTTFDAKQFKSATPVVQPEIKRSIEMSSPSSPKKTSEKMPERISEKMHEKTSKSMMNHMPASGAKEMQLPPSMKKGEPIFVRIDKFETALESIKMIKKKIDEMESLLVNLRQVNAKEDLELSEWEKEINMIKNKIDSIDANLFSKLG